MNTVKIRQVVGDSFDYWGYNFEDENGETHLFSGPTHGGAYPLRNSKMDLWSGFVDSAGKEIYENDHVVWHTDAICEVDEEIVGKIVYGDAAFFFEYEDRDIGTTGRPLYQENGWYTVTGNTHGLS